MRTPSAQSKEKMDIPQERLIDSSGNKNALLIGIPKEDQDKEKRLAFTPEAIDMITQAGHKVLLEEGAGTGINYSDKEYSESGAEIVSKEKAFNCDLVFKIAPPTEEEITLMKRKATVCSMLQLPDMTTKNLKTMCEKSLNAIAYELITDGSNFPIRCSISEIEGAASISVASEFLSNDRGGKGILMGGVPGVSPTEVVIIGAGTAGTMAAKAALSLGAAVKVFDDEISKLRELQSNLSQNVFTSVFQPNVLVNAFKSADVVIGAMRYINDPVRYIISEDVIRTMKKGSLIIDLRINRGGCFETTCYLRKDHPTVFDKYGIIHFCTPNLSSRVARTTAMALSNIFTPWMLDMGKMGGINQSAKSDIRYNSGLYMYAGKLVNAYVASRFNLPTSDINLYLSVF